MRALECECGQHLEASNDEELFEKVREHVDREHPEKELDDSQVRAIVTRKAYGYY
jgi:predicted small metal-binding protein